MIKVLSFDFYGVMYSNFDWKVINERIYPDEAKNTEFRELVDAANQGVIGNEQFRMRVSQLADDANHPEAPAAHLQPIVNTALMDYAYTFKEKDHVKLAILSNGGREHVCEVLEESGVLSAFDLIATSAELPSYKPEPEAFLYVANHFGVQPEELLHVDDSPRHIEGARNAGIQTILYTDLEGLKEELTTRLEQ